MNDTDDAEDEMEQRRRAQSSDHNLCSDTKMMQDRGANPISHRDTRVETRGGISEGVLLRASKLLMQTSRVPSRASSP